MKAQLANELRIGNYLYCGDEMVELNDVGNAWHTHRFLDPKRDWISPKTRVREYSAVRLSKGFLLSIGFVHHELESWYDLNGFEIDFSNKYEYWLDNKNIEVKHVHQLQNLYFSLEGKELVL